MTTIDNKNITKAKKLALEILELSKNQLIVSLRFMDSAFLSLNFFLDENVKETATDGVFFYYNINHILLTYKEEKELITRNYLHLILHLIFKHLFVDNKLVRKDIWDLSCDIAVENIISEMDLKITKAKIEQAQEDYILFLKKKVNILTAEKLYRYFLDNNFSKQRIGKIQKLFYADNHQLWYKIDKLKEDYGGSGGNDDELEGEAKSQFQQNSSEGESLSESEVGESSLQSDNKENNIKNKKNKEKWEEISQQVKIDLETFSSEWGDEKGSLIQNIKSVNKDSYDYSTFLKKFSSLGETIQINDDEFDYVYYTYGLRLYENMPLIEPLEYKEDTKIKDFVIAIDTSGSVSGKLVENFINKTYSILSSRENFFTKFNIHIIQSDASIQHDEKITSKEEFEEYMKDFKVIGFGGTDFRPVFEYVDELIRNKEFNNLKGLIYFTDGYGTFPTKKPKYQTAFIFMGQDYGKVNVPPWAMSLNLEKEDIIER